MSTKKKVLLIDDEEDFCFFTKQNLEALGEFSVSYSTDPDKGLAIAKSEKPDVILLDILMPKKDGFRVLEALKKGNNTLSIPVIMLTAVGEDEAKIKAAQYYCDNYVTKPASFETLKAKIDAVLEVKNQGG